MKKFNIITKSDIKSKELAAKIKDALLAYNYEFEIDNPELVIILGGDGKLLRTVHNYIDKIDKINFISVLTGTLGFSSDYHQDEIDSLIESILHGESFIEKVHLLEATLNFKDNQETHYALNELRLENRYHTCNIDVYLNNKFFETFKGNGLCISTPFGSTGYNKSLNGAVVLNGVDVLQITEIAGIRSLCFNSLGNSLIVPKDMEVELKSFTKYHLIGLDHLTLNNQNLQSIKVKFSDKTINLIHFKNKDSIDRIQKSFIVNKK